MTETPTPDDLARWAAEHHGWTPEDYPDSGEFCVECGEHMPCPTTRLLALVAAQAEQNAELRGPCETCEVPLRRVEAERDLEEQRADGNARRWHTQRERAERAEAELSALRATDEYQRWARAVVERDAAREAVGRVRALCELATKTVPSSHYAVGAFDRADEVLRALEGRAAT